MAPGVCPQKIDRPTNLWSRPVRERRRSTDPSASAMVLLRMGEARLDLMGAWRSRSEGRPGDCRGLANNARSPRGEQRISARLMVDSRAFSAPLQKRTALQGLKPSPASTDCRVVAPVSCALRIVSPLKIAGLEGWLLRRAVGPIAPEGTSSAGLGCALR